MAAASKADCRPYKIGQNYIVRTVTMIFTGKLVAVYPQELVLVDVSWIPETGRYADFVAKGTVNECEPYPEGLEVLVGRASILDCVPLSVALPRTQK